MLNAQYLINEESVRKFLMHTQDDVVGGFSKYEDSTSGTIFLTIYSCEKILINKFLEQFFVFIIFLELLFIYY